MPCLLLIVTIHFTCGERRIWENIKKSQNIMTKIVDSHLISESGFQSGITGSFGPWVVYTVF